MRAARDGHTEVVKLLLCAGVDVNHTSAVLLSSIVSTHQSQNGWTVLIGAACKGHTEVVKLFLSAGAEINYADKECSLVLHRLTSQRMEKSLD